MSNQSKFWPIKEMILNEKGFSLIQVLLLSGALSASALVAIQAFKQQKDVIKEADIKDRVGQVHTMIYSILQNRNHCLKTLVDNLGSNTITPNETKVLSVISMVDSPNAAFESDPGKRYMNESVSIDLMELVLPADLADFATLNITYSRHGNGKVDRSDTIRKSMKLSLQRKNASELLSCYSVTSNDGSGTGELGNETVTQELCEDLDIMQWDSNLRLCVLKQNLCANNKIFVGLDASGNKICKELREFLPHLIKPTFTNTCPDDYDTIKLTRDLSPPYLVSLECNKTNFTCPSEHAVVWTVGALTCYGQIPRGQHGQIISTTDVIPAAKGSANFRCNAGTWEVVNPTRICEVSCSGQTLNWTVAGNTCSASIVSSNNNAIVNLTDSTVPNTGASVWRCNNGTWEIAGATSCAP